jgi:hypothetical protein
MLYENMPDEDKISYKRFMENRRNEASSLDTAKENGMREAAIKIAMNSLQSNIPIPIIAKITDLTLSEIETLARGERLDVEDEDDDGVEN